LAREDIEIVPVDEKRCLGWKFKRRYATDVIVVLRCCKVSKSDDTVGTRMSCVATSVIDTDFEREVDSVV
jgi:hypothetical protein